MSQQINHLKERFAPHQRASWQKWVVASRLSEFFEIGMNAVHCIDGLINAMIDRIDFSKFQSLEILTNPEQGVDLSQTSPIFLDFFEEVLTQYFNRIELETKRSILKDLFALSDTSDQKKVLSVLLHNSGPVLQKAFQLFGDQSKSASVHEIMMQLKAQIKPFSNQQARKIIEFELGIDMEREFAGMPDKPLAAATIGQVYLVKDSRGRELIIKVMRPNLVLKAKKEFEIMRDCTANRAILGFLLHLEKSLAEELDFKTEVNNLKAGQVYQGRDSGRIQVVRLSDRYQSTHQVLVMERAPGRPIHKIERQQKKQAAEGLLKLHKIWLQEAVFESHFFHADLHAGNIFFDFHDDDYLITLIDFGNAAYLSMNEAKGLVKIMLGVQWGLDDLVCKNIFELCEYHTEQKEFIRRHIKEFLQLRSKPIGEKIVALLNGLAEIGVVVPKNLLLFHRGVRFIENQLNQLGAELEQADMYKKILENYHSVFKWQLLKDLWSAAQGTRDEKKNYIDNEVILNWLKSLFSHGS